MAAHMRPGITPSHLQQMQMNPTAYMSQQQAMVIQQQAEAAAAMAARKKLLLEEEEIDGDDLDNLTIRDVAVARYRRNHDYIAEIFSAYHINDIQGPDSPYAKLDKKELEERIERYKKEIDELQNNQEETVNNYVKSLTDFSDGIRKVTDAKDEAELNSVVEQVESMMGQKVKQIPLVETVPLENI